MLRYGRGFLNCIEELKKCSGAPETDSEKEDAPAYTFTDVRGALAAKSQEGYKKEIKALLTDHGAEKLSDIDPSDYAALMAELGELTHE
jgi:hypothetical protein